jgi:hypothetical protein
MAKVIAIRRKRTMKTPGGVVVTSRTVVVRVRPSRKSGA